MLKREVEIEYEIELLRQKLINECEEFNTVDAFRVMDKEGKGFIDALDLQRVLKTIDIHLSVEDVITFF